MSTVIVTGAHGLVGSESVKHFCRLGYDVAGVDNDMRAHFFGPDASTKWQEALLREANPRYRPVSIDIRDEQGMAKLFAEYSSSTELVIHTAAQPSHDWAAREPLTDFTVNAHGTLVLLEATRQFCPDAVFIFTSTNKVY